MKQNRFVFSVSLFWEGVRRTKLAGILFCSFSALQVILSTVLPALIARAEETASAFSVTPDFVGGQQITPISLMLFCVFAPILAFTLFGFLNKRSGSDFYHALPVTRTCLFLSFYASAVFWILACTVISALFGVVLTAIFSRYFILLTGEFFLYLAATAVSACAVCAAIITAISVTGTVFSNLCVSALILFFPRLLISGALFAVTESVPFLSGSVLPPLADPGINLVFGLSIGGIAEFLFGLSPFTPSADILVSPASIAYTAALTVVYLVLGCVLFCRRPSETAHRSASSGKIQALFRIIITFAYFAFFLSICFASFLENGISVLDLFLVLFFGVLLYFLYELITTKSFKKMLRAFPGLGIVALACLIFAGALFALRADALGFTPEPNEITSVALIPEKADSGTLFPEDYVSLVTQQTEVRDPAVCKTVSERLKEEVRVLRENGIYGSSESFNDTYLYPGNVRTTVYPRALTLSVSTKSTSRVRVIWLSEEEYALFATAQHQSPDWHDEMPPLPAALGSFELSGWYVNTRLPADHEILASAREEFAAIPLSEWYAGGNDGYGDNAAPTFTLYFTAAEGVARGREIAIDLCAYAHCFPKTVGLCLAQEKAEMDKRAEELSELIDSGDGWTFQCDLSLEPDGYKDLGKTDAEDLRALLASRLDRARSGAENPLTLNVAAENTGLRENYRYFSFFLDENAPEIKALLGA